jgi:hypothetical protein
MVLDARTLAKPANYALVRIKPPADCPADDAAKRPFVIIDPRAGHGPGIGGFKIDRRSASRCGRPPGATSSSSSRTRCRGRPSPTVTAPRPSSCASSPSCIPTPQALRHRQLPGRLGADDARRGAPDIGGPARCWPDRRCRTGPASLARLPMRYSGGLLGGAGWRRWPATWATASSTARTSSTTSRTSTRPTRCGSKWYHLYANIDTEPERFLEFERWWGGHYLMNKEEMAGSSQNLFVGNKLSSGEASLDGKPRVDLRRRSAADHRVRVDGATTSRRRSRP